MQTQDLLRRGSIIMVAGAALFLLYAIAFFFRALSGEGFEIGVATLGGASPAQLSRLNPAVVPYMTHLHVAVAGFIAATAIAVIGLSWFGVRAGEWWAFVTAVISPVVGLVVAIPMHYLGHFELDWVAHLGPIYLGTLIFVVGAALALLGLMRTTSSPITARPI